MDAIKRSVGRPKKDTQTHGIKKGFYISPEVNGKFSTLLQKTNKTPSELFSVLISIGYTILIEGTENNTVK